MTLAEKVALYKQAHKNTEGLPFGQRNLILSDIAKAMGLVHVHGDNLFSLRQKRARSYIIELPQ